jgi:diguanylate cyclase (GGDEF)-like protein
MVNYHEKRSLLISFALFFLVMITFVINYLVATWSQQLTLIVFSVSFIAMFIIAIMSNLFIYETKKEMKRLKKLQDFDPLTGCPNWVKFQTDCRNLLQADDNALYAMIVFDIDKFKAINDLYGHEVGNVILTQIAGLLKKHVGEGEIFARTATDHFNILMKCGGYTELLKRIEELIEEINSDTLNYSVHTSLGIYFIDDKTIDINTMSDRANMARRSIKDNSQVRYALYDESMRHILIQENHIENKMEAALLNGEFEVYLQPKYMFADEKIIGAEALVRWNDPLRGMVSPNDFIPLFEKNGFVKKIDTYMFESVCRLLSKWKKEVGECTGLIISVNFSRLNLYNRLLPEELLAVTRCYDISPGMIEIELTEGTLFDNDTQMIEIMNQLKSYGFRISIDDFGKAYSSLNTLKNLPADILKLDKAFFKESADNGRGKTIISSMLNMAKDLELITVAEGVETKEQVDFLKALGCDIAQGFYYAKPMNVIEFEEFVNKKLKTA